MLGQMGSSILGSYSHTFQDIPTISLIFQYGGSWNGDTPVIIHFIEIFPCKSIYGDTPMTMETPYVTITTHY